MPQPKDKDWLYGYKNKTPKYVVYKRPTSKQVKGWKKIFHTYRDLWDNVKCPNIQIIGVQKKTKRKEMRKYLRR